MVRPPRKLLLMAETVAVVPKAVAVVPKPVLVVSEAMAVVVEIAAVAPKAVAMPKVRFVVAETVPAISPVAETAVVPKIVAAMMTTVARMGAANGQQRSIAEAGEIARVMVLPAAIAPAVRGKRRNAQAGSQKQRRKQPANKRLGKHLEPPFKYE